MLSAQKQEMPEDTPPENSSPPPSGFGRVLSSIQGLQQRLDDFSVEEVSRAHAKAAELIQQLGTLQARLNALEKFKCAFADASATTASAPEIDYDLIEADGLENHPQLRAIVQAEKLIRTHGLQRPPQRSADSVFSESPTNPLVSGDALDQTHLAGAVDSETIARPQSLPDERLPNLSPKNDSTSARPDPSPLTAPGAFTLVNSSYEPPSAGTEYDFADLKLEDAPASGSHHDASPAQAEERAAETQPGKAAGSTRFNQRLLSELIDTYGEFAVSVEPTRKRTAPTTNPPTSQNHLSPESVVAAKFEPAPAPSPDVLVGEVAKRDAAAAEITAPEPAFVEPIGGRLALPAPEEAISEPAFEQTLPNAKARGEIDRQLKNIIKDYGAVDLYSHRKSVSTKTAAIAAAAALALVLGGIFFFKAPSSNHSPAPMEAGTSGADAEPAASPMKNQKQN